MNDSEALKIIKTSVDTVCTGGYNGEINMDTDLVGDGILDSLDSMNFLFEIESEIGKKIPEIDEDFEDFRVAKIVELIKVNT